MRLVLPALLRAKESWRSNWPMSANSAIDSDTYSAPLCAPVSARHCGR
jgi:hypothetical protein